MREEFSDLRFTPVFWKNEQAWKNEGIRYVVNQGGTSSSKSISILQLLYFIARNHKNLVISVVSETVPHLRKGVMRDFEKMLKQCGAYTDLNHHKTDNIFKFPSGSIIEFFSADDYGKVHGPRRDILYINECNNIKWDIYDQLEIRTRLKVFLDFNPVREFWVHEEVTKLDDAFFIKSTYKDNPYLPDQIKKSIESKQHKANWWRVYGLGEVGFIEGLVFPDINLVDEMPEQWKKRGYGLDFGFTNDPTCMTDNALSSGELWIDQLIYETGLTNPDIAEKMNILKVSTTREIIADSAEPKSIAEIRTHGNWKILGAVKGPDSVKFGLDLMSSYPINITKRSVETITEYRNYTWDTDKDGKLINQPIDDFNHSIDSSRYWATRNISKRVQKRGLVTTNRI